MYFYGYLPSKYATINSLTQKNMAVRHFGRPFFPNYCEPYIIIC